MRPACCISTARLETSLYCTPMIAAPQLSTHKGHKEVRRFLGLLLLAASWHPLPQKETEPTRPLFLYCPSMTSALGIRHDTWLCPRHQWARHGTWTSCRYRISAKSGNAQPQHKDLDHRRAFISASCSVGIKLAQWNTCPSVKTLSQYGTEPRLSSVFYTTRILLLLHSLVFTRLVMRGRYLPTVMSRSVGTY